MKSKHLIRYTALLLAVAVGTDRTCGQSPEPADIVRTCPAVRTAPLPAAPEAQEPAPAQRQKEVRTELPPQPVSASLPLPSKGNTAGKRLSEEARYAFGVHIGLDLGAAAPWPPAHLRGGAMKMSAVPKLSPSLGLSFTAHMPYRLSLTAELTYKQVGIDAEAWVSGQQFRLPNPDGEDLVTRFRGTANVMMNFSMLELPVYVGYSFGGGRNRVYLGAYYSYILRSRFNTTPLKGLVETPGSPAKPPILVTPDTPVPPEAMPVFNDYLGKWDAGLLLGYEWQIVPRVRLTARFSMGFKDIFRRGSNYLEYKMLHMRGTVAVSYAFLRYDEPPFRK